MDSDVLQMPNIDWKSIGLWVVIFLKIFWPVILLLIIWAFLVWHLNHKNSIDR